MLICLTLVSCLIAVDEPSAVGGTVSGTVVNLSENCRLVANIEVILRAELDGEFIPVAATRTDNQGVFTFHGVPLEMELTYQAGANLDGIHYPGPRVRMGPQQHSATVNLTVRETTEDPTALIIRRQEIVIKAEPGALYLTEALLVDNPTLRTYVGRRVNENESPVTLELGIPADFERITFEDPFFGRSFSLLNGKLSTGVPWEPGKRWLRFTYTLRNEQSYRRFERKLDATCDQIQVRVLYEQAAEINSDLPLTTVVSGQERVFRSNSVQLPAGHIVRVELGALPISWMAYGRWGAVALLIAIVAGMSILVRTKRQTAYPNGQSATNTEYNRRHSPAKRIVPAGRRSRRFS